MKKNSNTDYQICSAAPAAKKRTLMNTYINSFFCINLNFTCIFYLALLVEIHLMVLMTLLVLIAIELVLNDLDL